MEVHIKNGIVLVDDEDWEYLKELKWYIDTHNGYTFTSIYMKFKKRNQQFKMEWFILGKKKGFVIDHINGNKCDNRKENLRFVTVYQNNLNRLKRKNSKSNYKGVTFDDANNKWKARITFNKKEYFLGRFDSEIDAAKAYDEKSKELFGELGKRNFS